MAPHKQIKLLAMASVLLLASLPLSQNTVAAQAESDRDQAEQQEPPKDITKQTNQQRRERYYLGNRPKLKRQVGPALGAPKTIIPSPFVPKGSLKLTVPIDADAGEQAAGQSGTVQGPISDENTGALLGPIETGLGPIETGELSALDPSGVSGLPDGVVGFPSDFWQGYTRYDVIWSLVQASGPRASIVQQAILKRLAASPMILDLPQNTPDKENPDKENPDKENPDKENPEQENPDKENPEQENPERENQDIDAMMRARLAVLNASGDTKAYQQFVSHMPAEHNWRALSREITDAFLLGGQLAEACATAADMRRSDTSAYWLRLSAFCAATTGNRGAVDFELEILEELTAIEPSFYQLIDQIIFEAGQDADSTRVEGTALETPLKLDLLTIVMARLARVTVPQVDAQGASPLAVAAALELNGLDQNAGIILLHQAVNGGALTPSALAAFVRTYPISDKARIEARSDFEANPEANFTANKGLGDTDPATNTYTNDAPLGVAGSEITVDIPPNVAAFAHQLAQIRIAVDATDLVEKQDLFERAYAVSHKTVLAPALAAVLDGVPASGGNSAFADPAIRSAMLALDRPQGHGWWVLLRSYNQPPGGVTFKLSHSFMQTWPLAHIVGAKNAPDLSHENLNKWWQAVAEDDNAYEKAATLFILLDALGRTVPDTAWNLLKGGPAAYTGYAPEPSPALWRAMIKAAEKGDRAGTLLAGLRLLRTKDGARPSISLTSSVVGHFTASGLTHEAHLLAVEALLSRGF